MASIKQAQVVGEASTCRLRRYFILALGCLLGALALGFSADARAAASCSVSTPPLASLGSASSLQVSLSGNRVQVNTGFQCQGVSLTFLGQQTITATIGNKLNLVGPSGDSLPFILCSSSDCGSIYSSGQTISWQDSSLAVFTNASGSLSLYVRILNGRYNVAAGTYNGSFSVQWSWHLCDIGIGSICLYDDGHAQETVSLTMQITNDCIINAPAINFGSAPLVGGFATVSQRLSVRCTKGSSYTVGLSDGSYYGNGSRRMANGAAYLAYEIYQPSGQRWGAQGSERRSSANADVNANNLDGQTAQQFDYRAQILSNQSTPPPGTYTDNVIVDVQF